MRLTSQQHTAIRTASSIDVFDANVGVWLFGSRADDCKRGGDIDLRVQPGSAATDQLFNRKIQFLTKLEREIGERKVNVVITTPHDTRPIVAVARATGIRIV